MSQLVLRMGYGHYDTNVGLTKTFPIRATVPGSGRGSARPAPVSHLRYPPPAQLVPRMGYGHDRPSRVDSCSDEGALSRWCACFNDRAATIEKNSV